MNSNKTITATFVESVPPTVTLNTPINNSIVRSTSVEFNVTATDNLLLKNATLYLVVLVAEAEEQSPLFNKKHTQPL